MGLKHKAMKSVGDKVYASDWNDDHILEAGLLADRPAPGVEGRLYWASDVRILYRDTGSTWEVVAFGSSTDGNLSVKKITITPATGGADALVVKSSDGLSERIRLTEDGKIMFEELDTGIYYLSLIHI